MDKRKKTYKTIFFDWHNTLSTLLFWDQWKNPEHPRHEWYAPLSRYLLGENMLVVMEWMRGRVSAEEISGMLADRFGYSRDIIFQDLKESCESMRLVSEEILPLVQKLREKGTKCVIATDNMDTFTRFTVPALRLSEHTVFWLLYSFLSFKMAFESKRMEETLCSLCVIMTLELEPQKKSYTLELSENI